MSAALYMTPEDKNSDSTPDLLRFPIRVLAEKTGIGTSTLRAWERRYGLLQPERTPKGHRLYGLADIKRVEKITDLLNDGHSLPRIADLLSVDGGADNLAGETPIDGNNPELASIWEKFIQSTLEAISDFSIERIDAIYNEASSLYPIDLVTDKLIQPTLLALGEIWKQRPDHG